VTATVVGGTVGYILSPLAGTLESSYGATSQGLITKYINGTITQAAPITIAKMVTAETFEQNAIPSGILGNAGNDFLNQNLPSANSSSASAPQQGFDSGAKK
jgi:hypothetical protein